MALSTGKKQGIDKYILIITYNKPLPVLFDNEPHLQKMLTTN